MTFEQYWIIFFKHWKLLILCSLFMGAGTAIGSRLMTRLYQSTTLVQVTVSADSAYTSLLASNQVVQTEATLATGDSVLSEVASRYKGLTVEQLSKEVTATPKLNTQLFEISVLDPNPNQAAILANDVATTLIKQQFDLTRQGPVQMNLLVVQHAQANPKPAQPNTLLNTGAGFLAGLLLGLVLAVLFEKLDTRIRSSEIVSQFLDLPVLATLWMMNNSKKKNSHSSSTINMNVEPYRMLRTSLEFFDKGTSLKTLMITSALPEDGRTTVAINLATFMAKAGKNTLVVDANLRHPALYKQFSVAEDALGLSDAILAMNAAKSMSEPSSPPLLSLSPSLSTAHTTHISLENFVHPTSISNLWVMPSGTLLLHSPELFASRAMHSLMETMKSYAFDIVIFDTPPLLGLSDSSILASRVDGIILVIDITRVTKGLLQQVKNLLSRDTIQVIGCVVNKQYLSSKDKAFSPYRNDKEDTDVESASPISSAPLCIPDPKAAISPQESTNKEYLTIADDVSIEERQEKKKDRLDLDSSDQKTDKFSEETIKLTPLITRKGKNTNHAI